MPAIATAVRITSWMPAITNVGSERIKELFYMGGNLWRRSAIVKLSLRNERFAFKDLRSIYEPSEMKKE